MRRGQKKFYVWLEITLSLSPELKDSLQEELESNNALLRCQARN